MKIKFVNFSNELYLSTKLQVLLFVKFQNGNSVGELPECQVALNGLGLNFPWMMSSSLILSPETRGPGSGGVIRNTEHTTIRITKMITEGDPGLIQWLTCQTIDSIIRFQQISLQLLNIRKEDEN